PEKTAGLDAAAQPDADVAALDGGGDVDVAALPASFEPAAGAYLDAKGRPRENVRCPALVFGHDVPEQQRELEIIQPRADGTVAVRLVELHALHHEEQFGLEPGAIVDAEPHEPAECRAHLR